MEGIGATTSAHRGAVTTDSLLYSLEEHDGPAVVVILDEVDQLQDESVLADLYRTQEVSMLLIANHEGSFSPGLTTVSSPGCAGRYGCASRNTIGGTRLDSRRPCTMGSRHECRRNQLAQIADAAAGDARVTISILRNAARRADSTLATQ